MNTKVIYKGIGEHLFCYGKYPIRIDWQNHALIIKRKRKDKIILLDECYLSDRRIHVENVIDYGVEIADLCGFSELKPKIYIAAFLHDIGKGNNFLANEHERFFRDNEISINLNYLLQRHALESTWYARDVLGITDRQILKAIAYHQTGPYFKDYAGMNKVEKIIICADNLGEKERPYQQLGFETIKETKNLNIALLVILTGKVQREIFKKIYYKNFYINDNLLKLWELMEKHYQDGYGIFNTGDMYDEADAYIADNQLINKLLLKLYFEEKIKSKEKLIAKLKNIPKRSADKFAAQKVLELFRI